MSNVFAKTLATLAAVGALTAAGPAAAERPDWANKIDATIVEAAVAASGIPFQYDDNGNDFDILVTAVIATGYFIDPLNGEDDYTVFAPVDSAFVGLVEALIGGPLTDDNMNGSVEDEAVDVLVFALGVGQATDLRDDPGQVCGTARETDPAAALDNTRHWPLGGFLEGFGLSGGRL